MVRLSVVLAALGASVLTGTASPALASSTLAATMATVAPQRSLDAIAKSRPTGLNGTALEVVQASTLGLRSFQPLFGINHSESSVNSRTSNSNISRTIFLSSQVIFALAIGLTALALTYGVYEYQRYHRWQRLEFLRRAVQEFEGDTEIRNALKILDLEEYRDYPLPSTEKEQAGSTFKVTDQLIYASLAGHNERARTKKAFDEKRAAGSLSPEELNQYQIETTLREWFNKMLNGLEHFGYFIESGLCTPSEIKPWLLYWIKLIGDASCRREGSSQLYDQLYGYIHEYGFLGVQRLFERFGYRILQSPYRQDDFVLPANIRTYDTKLALSLAKASLLIYHEKKYVAEIARRWGIDIKGDFRYFNNRGRDTQAFMFRTDEFMVLAFRGSQELRDWLTNFSTKLRNFTIRKEGITTMSSYKGKVHTGFFLGWASIERSVLDQISRWRKDSLKQGKELPPLVITGHSLGGALATMAAASLSENGIDVVGLYTFGQPRVGDWGFTRQLNNNLNGKVFRFINNNDVVPHIPPPFSPFNPLRLYGHLGEIKYFNSRGLLVLHNKILSRTADSLIGFIKGLFESGLDLIADHDMTYYISHLNKSLLQELEDKAAEQLDADKTRV